jgi:hypothetical protein
MLPNVALKVQDGGLGQATGGGPNLLAIIGCSSSGPANVPIVTANPADIITQNGYGPGPQCAAFVIDESGNPAIFVKATTVSAGSNTAVTALVPGGSTSVVTLTGTPIDTYYGVVTVLTGGTIGTAGIQIGVSLDAARSQYQIVNLGTATTYAIPNTGLTLNFGAGTMVLGDTYRWLSTEPKWNDAGIASAIQSLYGLPFGQTFLDIIVVGDAAGADTVAFDTYMTQLFNKRRFSRLLCAARDASWGGASTESENTWIAAIEADHVNDSSLRVGVTAGHYNFISPIDEVQYRRPLLFGAAARDASVAIQVDLGRVKDGALAGLIIPTTPTLPGASAGPSTPDGFIYHDESVNPGLDAARFMAAMTFVGLPGYYIANSNLMAPPGSDFNWLQHAHVIDAASLITYLFMTQQLSDSVRVDKTTGHILEVDAQQLEGQLNAQLLNGLTNPGAVTSATVSVSRTDNILATSTITAIVSVIPLGYIKAVNVTLRFLNPAIRIG